MKCKILAIISIVGLALASAKPASAIFLYRDRLSEVEINATNLDGIGGSAGTTTFDPFSISFEQDGSFMDDFGANTGMVDFEQTSILEDTSITAELSSLATTGGNRSPIIFGDNQFLVDFTVTTPMSFEFSGSFLGNTVNVGSQNFVNVSLTKLSGPDGGFPGFSSGGLDSPDDVIVTGVFLPGNEYRLRVVANADSLGDNLNMSSGSVSLLTTNVESVPESSSLISLIFVAGLGVSSRILAIFNTKDNQN